MKRFGTLALLDFPYAFSQRRPLNEKEFLEEADARGVHLDRGQLEAFHQSGVLIPLFISSAPLLSMKRSDTSGHTHLKQLRDSGSLVDPRQTGFTSWRRFRRRNEWGFTEPTRIWLYSYYQLLGIQRLAGFQRYLRPLPTAFERPHYRLRDLPWLPRPTTEALDIGVVALLSRLEPIYLPYVIQRIALGLSPEGAEAWYAKYATYRQTFDPCLVLEEFEIGVDELRQVGENLIVTANFIDPNRSWLDLLRQIAPERWTDLKGPGRLAIDLRISAELILSCYEDLADSNEAPPLPKLPAAASHPLKDRLMQDPPSLDRTLTHYRLSPHPAVLILPEGASDRLLLRKTLDVLRVRGGRAFIDIASTGGIDKNFDTLIGYSAPEPDQEINDLVVVSRPLTRFIRVVDAEGRMATAAGLRREQEHLARQVRDVWALKGGPPLQPAEFDGLVEVLTWGRLPMEFANFTDGELARAISDLSPAQRRLRATDLRHLRGKALPGARLKGLLEQRGIDKLQLAGSIWPTLEKRIRRLIAAGRENDVPMVRIIRRAMELGMMTPRGPVGLKKA